MLRQTLAGVGIATLIGSGMSMAAGPAHPANNETGTVYHGAEYTRVEGRVARVDRPGAQTGRSLTFTANGDWEYAGGETGWQLEQHRFDFVNGRLVHSDTIPLDTPKPSIEAQPSSSPYGHLGSGA